MSKIGAADRARRMLGILHHLEPGAAVPLEKLAEMVGTTPSDLADDIATLSMCGVAPYYPDDLVAVFVEDGLVHVWAPVPALDRAVRLSASEAQALASALQAAGFGASHELTARLLEAAAADFSAAEMEHLIRSAVTEASSDVYQTIALGIERSVGVRIIYRRLGSEADSTREIDPLALVNDRGHWYVSAFCHLAGAPRTFRLDRIRSARLTERSFSRDPDNPAIRAFSPEGLPLATLLFADAGSFSEREWPGARTVGVSEQGLTVEVPYSGTAWIARMVASRLGDVQALAPADVRGAVAALAKREACA